MSKYYNVKTTIDGITFDSKAEAERWCELRLMERAGTIKDLQRQVKFVLQPSFRKNGKTYREIAYIADFVYLDMISRKNIVEDVKGVETAVFKLKKRMFEYRFPELTITEVKKR